MRPLHRRGLALALVALSVVQCSRPSAQAQSPAEVAQAVALQFRQAIDTWASAPGHRGVSALVVLADGAQWNGAAGQAGDEPLRDDHLIAIASITKTMTAAVILRLVDEGVVRLDDPIGRWLMPRRYIDPAITVRQLLNHTNGLANYTTNPALSAAAGADLTHVFTVDELLDFVGPPRFPAGTDTEYTNTAFLLLGQIAERATNRSIVDLYHQRLWEPLALTDIFLPGLEEAPGAVATAYNGATVIVPLERMSLQSIGNSAYGLMSNATTIARWGHALFGGRVFSDEMQAAMRTLVPGGREHPG